MNFLQLYVLKKIAKKVVFIRLNENDNKFIKELDKRHYLRYTFDEVDTHDLQGWHDVFNSIKIQMPIALLKKLAPIENQSLEIQRLTSKNLALHPNEVIEES